MIGAVTGVVVAGAVLVPYLLGWSRLRTAGGGARSTTGPALAAIGAGLLGLALAPPLEAWAGDLFTWHMAQHLLLGLVVPLVLVMARAGEVAPWALAPATRTELRRTFARFRSVARQPAAPLWAGAIHLAVWAVWHVPAAYDAALHTTSVHVLEHVSLLATGAFFWSTAVPRGRRAGPAILALFGVSLGSGVLAATLALAPTAFYEGHLVGATAWGVDPITDQQLGGLLMWTPAGLVYLAAAVAQLVRWVTADRSVPLRLAGVTTETSGAG